MNSYTFGEYSPILKSKLDAEIRRYAKRHRIPFTEVRISGNVTVDRFANYDSPYIISFTLTTP